MNTSSLAEESGIVPTMIRAAALAKIEVHPLRRNISVLEGSGGNIVVLTGKDGKLLIDAGFTVSKPRVAPALDSLSTDPITRLINTHWHVDHTDGNAWLHAAGAAITAHGNTKKHLSTSTRVEGWSYTFTPAPAEALPTTTFRDAHRLRHNDTSLTLKYYGPAHTDGDISVVFEEADVIQVGDTWWNGFYPFIDYSTGGSIDGMINATSGTSPCDGEDNHHSWPRPCGRQGSLNRVLQHAGRHPGECRKTQEARQIAGRNDRGNSRQPSTTPSGVSFL